MKSASICASFNFPSAVDKNNKIFYWTYHETKSEWRRQTKMLCSQKRCKWRYINKLSVWLTLADFVFVVTNAIHSHLDDSDFVMRYVDSIGLEKKKKSRQNEIEKVISSCVLVFQMYTTINWLVSTKQNEPKLKQQTRFIAGWAKCAVRAVLHSMSLVFDLFCLQYVRRVAHTVSMPSNRPSFECVHAVRFFS